ncbi:zinc finger protein 761-like isoform X1 [Neodiprion virginianus]|uniref:zinc finger protein 761-like isoform X1 n=1 Tax=Neodiprion virginianus TaxID=2961670 RepID=UPI001EE748E3|nr:zinc finger protein 761-like isoform X1 [Neodiprion virginianus]XP_046614024.1 zinc finger protein 761-like isoform X1 [Neodiprion virginianus]XP_046614025.1 zinc finger protein 761-like isoform X1 [Neodiprion virginianus]XP_046614026.1 zinc finger protein 761-like isoform X1 [Neodiprion virginianus]XP_046614027.1 zinc finger protein 761-like isoform X1 [Neodiprion virginianus]
MLKLVLQTQEGQQIEVTVSPDDTFADLQRLYESPENPGLFELLKHLITSGIDVDARTKVFDYVTNSSSTEWLVEESLDDISGLQTVDTLQTIIEETRIKECCVEDCSNTNLTAPNKVFFPLPTEKDRLSAWLMGIGKPDLLNVGIEFSTDIADEHFVCADHFAPSQFLKGTDQVLKRRACPSLTQINIEDRASSLSNQKQDPLYLETETSDKSRLPQIMESNKDLGITNAFDSAILDELDIFNDVTHPGRLCRLCGEHTLDPVYLFSPNDHSNNKCTVADKINICLPITVTAKDPLPKQVCAQCLEKLDTCHKLATTCLETEDKLKSMFEMKKFHVNVVNDKRCPLCISGNMQIVTKSGIYRKDKAESFPEILKNSSARTRQVSPSKSNNNKTEILSSVDREPLRDFYTDIPASITQSEDSIKNENVPLRLPSYLSQGELLCSICSQKEDNIEQLTEHAKQHNGYPCTICADVNFKTVNEQQLHFLRHGVNRGYCETCSLEWTNPTDAAEHLKICKPEFWSLECAHCGEKFPHIEAGNKHNCQMLITEVEGFKCDLCGKKYMQKINLNMHMRSHEKREAVYYKCSFCNKQFTRKGSLHKHVSTLHSVVESATSPKCYKCRKCDEAFVTSASAEAHITEKHFSQLMIADVSFTSNQFTADEINLSRVYICEYCERCYTIPSSLHDHRQNEHYENSDYQCNICNSSFETYKSLSRHKTLHIKENDLEDLGIKQYYLCNYCNKTFLHYGTLMIHTSQHQQPLPYLCRLCNFQCATYKEVAEHRKNTHPYQSVLHERPNNLYHCQYCEKSFCHEVALIKHIRMHTGERPYKCSICGKGFSQTSGLYTHLKVHSNLRPYTCPQCPQTFKIKGDRDNHVKKHSGDRPYKCDFCEKAFMTQHVYSQHRKIHTNERPYKCDVCGEAFRRSHVLTVHMRRHTGAKPHTCDMCSKAYRQRGDLLKHKKIQHGVTTINSSSAVPSSRTALPSSSDISSSTESTTIFPIV